MFQHRRVIVSAVALLLVFLMTGGMAFSAYAESSSTIKARIESLKEQEQEGKDAHQDKNRISWISWIRKTRSTNS